MGIRPDLDGIRIAPSIPGEWKELTIDKLFRGKKLHIKVKNESGAESGYKEFYLNGKKLDDNYIPESMLEDENEILFVM